MSVVDPGLKFLQQESAESTERLSELKGPAVAGLDMAPEKPTVKVLVQFGGDIADLKKAGFETRTVAGDVATGVIPLEKVDAIAAMPQVLRLELTRPMQAELNQSLPEIRADLVHTGPPGNRGSGVIIGIIDSGIDLTHKTSVGPMARLAYCRSGTRIFRHRPARRTPPDTPTASNTAKPTSTLRSRAAGRQILFAIPTVTRIVGTALMLRVSRPEMARLLETADNRRLPSSGLHQRPS